MQGLILHQGQKYRLSDELIAFMDSGEVWAYLPSRNRHFRLSGQGADAILQGGFARWDGAQGLDEWISKAVSSGLLLEVSA